MRVLEANDLRWVSGGLCTHGNFTFEEVNALMRSWETAIGAMNDAGEHLAQQTPNTQAWINANAAYDAAISAESTAADAYYNGFYALCEVNHAHGEHDYHGWCGPECEWAEPW